LVQLEASESLVVVTFGNDVGFFHSFSNIDNDPSTLKNGALMLVPHVDLGRENGLKGRLSVRAISSGCNFLWSRYQHGGNDRSMHSRPWKMSVNVMDECVVVFNGTSRNGLTIGTRVVHMSWRGRGGDHGLGEHWLWADNEECHHDHHDRHNHHDLTLSNWKN